MLEDINGILISRGQEYGYV